MAKFVKKSEILCHLTDSGIKPRDPKFLQIVESYLFDKFAVHSHQLSEKDLQFLKSEVKAFHKEILRISKKEAWKKVRILTKHEVREFVFTKMVIFSNNHTYNFCLLKKSLLSFILLHISLYDCCSKF